MPTIEILQNTMSDIDYFENTLKRADKLIENALKRGGEGVSLGKDGDFVEGLRKLYNRQGDKMFISDTDLARLNSIAGGKFKIGAAAKKVAKKKPRKAKKKKVVRKRAPPVAAE